MSTMIQGIVEAAGRDGARTAAAPEIALIRAGRTLRLTCP